MRTKRIKLRKDSGEGFRLGYKFLGLIILALFIISLLPSQEVVKVYAKIEPEGVTNKRIDVLSIKDPPEINIQKEDPLSVETLEGLPVEEKIKLITLLFEQYNYSAEDIKIWLRIIKAESGYRETATPITSVKHCRRSNGTYYAVEIVNMNGLWVQASCNAGDVQTMEEKSYGLLQILPSSSRLYGCEGLDNWKKQLNCGVRMQMKSGFNSWTTY